MSQHARCDRCHHSGGDHAEGCGEPDEVPLSPIALDWEKALRDTAVANGWLNPGPDVLIGLRDRFVDDDRYRDNLNAQLRALVARVAQEEREKVIREIEAAKWVGGAEKVGWQNVADFLRGTP